MVQSCLVAEDAEPSTCKRFTQVSQTIHYQAAACSQNLQWKQRPDGQVHQKATRYATAPLLTVGLVFGSFRLCTASTNLCPLQSLTKGQRGNQRLCSTHGLSELSHVFSPPLQWKHRTRSICPAGDSDRKESAKSSKLCSPIFFSPTSTCPVNAL